MQKSIRFITSVLIMGAYLLSACTGAAPSQSSDPTKAQKVDSSEVVFTGIVEAINGDQWTVNGQSVVIDGLTALDANIKVGDVVKVEASVDQAGVITAVKIESSVADDANANSNNDNSGNANDDNSNDANANSNDNANANDNSNGNANGNGNEAVGGQDEVSGVVEVITSDTITIDGIVYNLADFTEFKDGIVVGDQVKVHVIVNADGTLTIREIEKSTNLDTDDNSNGNSNSDDQIGNSNGNSNGDDNGGGSNNNSNGDDNGGGSNDNSSNDDGGGNSNSNDD
jgi:hypothetical protein